MQNFWGVNKVYYGRLERSLKLWNYSDRFPQSSHNKTKKSFSEGKIYRAIGSKSLESCLTLNFRPSVFNVHT